MRQLQRKDLMYLQLRLLNLGGCSGHLVLQEGQLCICGVTVDTAGTLLQVPQRPLKPIHSTSSQVHLQYIKKNS